MTDKSTHYAMKDYQPVDLSPWCSVGTDFIGADAQPMIGKQIFHGLPFVVGKPDPDTSCCFIGFDASKDKRQQVTVPIGGTARCIIFAHALLESRVLQGEAVGRTVARYVCQYRDLEPVRLPVRERFEVSIVPTTWGQLPFLALPDQIDYLMPRYEGDWDYAGHRQTEARQGGAQGEGGAHSYYLWAWINPNPDNVIESVTFEPGDRKFVLAAMTLGHLDEYPFCRVGRQPIKITLPQLSESETPFNLAVDVDRGVATYPYQLPVRSDSAFFSDDLKGWGETQNEAPSPAYSCIAATPSATVTIRKGGDLIGHANWGELQAKGELETPKMRLEVVDGGKNWVHVSVLDDDTGQPVSCRIHFCSPEGIPYQPHGHHNHVNSNLDTWHVDVGGDLRLGQITYAYIDGRCQGWLPRGDVVVDVARGFEYEPLRTKISLDPGQRELTLRLRRWKNMNSERWFSGDSHVHFLGTQGALFEAQGEDLNVVNLLQSQWGHLFTNTEDFTGRPSLSEEGNTIVYCSQENRQHFLGHLILWGLQEPIMPWCTDGPGEAELGGTLDEAMSYWADATHAQGGTVVIPHLPNPNAEPAVMIATGRADAVEMLRHGRYEHIEYYRYLNCGYRLPLVGGTDKMSSDVPVGLYRTYAKIPEDQPFTYDNWCTAVRAGRTFHSGGPIISFSVEGAQIGDTLHLSGGGMVEVEATAESIFPIHTLEIVQQGRVVAATVEEKGARIMRLKTKVKVGEHSWLAARCGGPDYSATPHHDCWQRGVFAHTSPIYVAVGGDWWLFDEEAAQYMLTLIEGGLSYMRQTASHHRAGSVTYHHGEEDHLAYLERPFHQAREAIHRRLHAASIPH